MFNAEVHTGKHEWDKGGKLNVSQRRCYTGGNASRWRDGQEE